MGLGMVVSFLCAAVQLGDAALVRVALHAPLDGPLVLGSVLAGTFDFRASQTASSSGTPKCIQVGRSEIERHLWVHREGPSKHLLGRIAKQTLEWKHLVTGP